MTEHTTENDYTLTTAERYRLHAAAHLDNTPSKVAERLIEGRDPAVIEVVESILADRLAEQRCECCRGRCSCGGKRVTPSASSEVRNGE